MGPCSMGMSNCYMSCGPYAVTGVYFVTRLSCATTAMSHYAYLSAGCLPSAYKWEINCCYTVHSFFFSTSSFDGTSFSAAEFGSFFDVSFAVSRASVSATVSTCSCTSSTWDYGRTRSLAL